jgi:hypothetical protein
MAILALNMRLAVLESEANDHWNEIAPDQPKSEPEPVYRHRSILNRPALCHHCGKIYLSQRAVSNHLNRVKRKEKENGISIQTAAA